MEHEKNIVAGQKPLSAGIIAWICLLIVFWAGNSIFIKTTIRDIPPSWAAFLRFAPALPFIGLFTKSRKADFRISGKEFGLISIVAIGLFLQIFLFNLGSQWTNGGRITLFIFSYPLYVPVIAHFILREERLRLPVLLGYIIAFLGLLIPLLSRINAPGSSLKGDLIELASSLVLALMIVLNKRIIQIINKWTVFFWRALLSVVMFLVLALLLEDFDPKQVKWDAWLALSYQVLVVSIFCFLSYQYILANHNSSRLAVFFFATPLIGMALGMLVYQEPFDPSLLLGCLLVGVGIVVVNFRPSSTNDKTRDAAQQQ